MNQVQKKLSRNLNVVATFEDFSLDTQIVDFDVEDLVDYVTENADVFYWLNIEAIWGRCGFVWDSYENAGHFNNVSIKFNTLPRIPDPNRIKTFRGLFSKLDSGTYYINDNDWENITELGGWGTGKTYVFNMPSANFQTLYQKTNSDSSIYKPLSSLDGIDWTLSYSFHLKIDDDNRDIIQLDVTELFDTPYPDLLYLHLDNKDTEDEAVILKNIPDIIPYDNRSKILTAASGDFNRMTLHKQYVNEEGTIALRCLFNKTAKEYYWPYPNEDNPPIMCQIPSRGGTSKNLFTTDQADESKFINCKVVPGYKNGYTWEEDVVIPEEYDVFNNPNHKVRYIYSNSNPNVREGAAFNSNYVNFEHRLNLRVNAPRLSSLNFTPRFSYVGSEKDIVARGKPWSTSQAIEWLKQNDNTACGFWQYSHSTNKHMVVYERIALIDSGIEFYTDGDTIEVDNYMSRLYVRTPFMEGSSANEVTSIIRVPEGCKIHYNSGYIRLLMLQDVYYKSGTVIIPRDTTHKIIFDSDASVYTGDFLIIDCDRSKYTIPNVFDFSNVTIKEGYEIQDLVGFSTCNFYYFKHYIHPDDPVIITIDPTLDFIWQGDIKIVHNTTRSCKELMDKLQAGFIYDYPLSRVKQISTPTKTGNKIHLEGGFVFSLNDNDTVGNAEGVAYFLSKFKFRSNPKPKENQLYLNSEQYALFTTEQINTLLDNGWEVIEVVF